MAFEHITHPRKRAFLHAYAIAGRVKFAAEYAKVKRELHYDWKAKDAEYLAAFKVAEAMAADALVDEAKRRAHKGTREYILYKGEIVTRPVVDADGVVTERPILKRRYSDSLLQFLIEGLKPDTFHERREIAHSAPKDGNPLQIEMKHSLDLSGLSEDELGLLERIASKIGAGSGGGGTPAPDGT
jgi:hypothetical protein